VSRIEKLLNELCPDGVEYKALGSVGAVVRGKRFVKADMVNAGVSCIHYGEIYTKYGISASESYSFVSEDRARTLRFAQPGDVIMASAGETVEDIGKSVAWLGNEPIAIHDACYSFSSFMDPTFVSYFFASRSFRDQIRQQISSSKISSISTQNVAKARIPVPPIEVQREIVKILDKFTQLEAELGAELDAELEARRRQYEHYRLRILDKACRDAVFLEIGELGRVVTGRTPKSSDASAWGSDVDFITPTDIKNGLKVVSMPVRQLSRAGAVAMRKALVPAGSILVTCIGADMGKTVINANDCVTNQQINAIIPTSGVDVGYVFHLLTSMRDSIRTQGERGGGTMPIINKNDFSKIKLPVPPLAIQKEVAVKLDEFDAVVDDLSAGLPAELRARRKQYEYYRDKLLTFEELPA
jgi:type I restriction enzyme S subunit